MGRNKSYPVTFLTDIVGGAGGDYHTSYFPLPTFLSSRRYYCHLSGSNYMDLDFSHAKYHEISIFGPPEPIYFNVDEDFEALVRSLTYFLWRQPQLPDWVHNGVILGVQGGTKRVRLCKVFSPISLIPVFNSQTESKTLPLTVPFHFHS